jgi:hypothetical protein
MRGLDDMPPVEFDEDGVVIVPTNYQYRVTITVTSGEKWEGKWTEFDTGGEEVGKEAVYEQVFGRLAQAKEAIALVVKEGMNERFRIFFRNVIAYADVEVQEIYG